MSRSQPDPESAGVEARELARAEPRISLHVDEPRAGEPATSELLERLRCNRPELARYSSEGELARGGMGTIFRVFDHKDQLVAVTVATAFDAAPTLEELDDIDTGLPLQERLVAVTRVLQRRMTAVFDLMLAIRMTASPAEIEALHRRAQPAQADVVARVTELLAPDRRRFRRTVP